MVGRLALAEEVGAGVDRHLDAAGDERRELVVGEPVEQLERPQVVDAHQTVAR